ncbi:MAG: cupin domain-containing protein [Brevundimonas sp.]|nr:MAG: cupin domain-containing protein [Brevundimonas sp.]
MKTVPLIKAADARLTETPNAAMTTLASPTLGGSMLAMWRTNMEPGASGPVHTFDAEQIWTLEQGGATVVLDAVPYILAPGDTLVMPAGLVRQVLADPVAGMTALVVSTAGARATLADGADKGVPPWII